MASIEPFNRLVKLAARAFYDDITMKGENQQKAGRSDNRGIAVVILDALTRRQWIREEDLAKDLKLHVKQLRRALRFFEEEKLLTRDHRKETSKGAKIYNSAVAATVDGQRTGRGDEKLKMHTQTYCCLDYSQIYDVVRYRLYRMKKKLKDELESKNTVQGYICPNCSKRYTALDALGLISPDDDDFHCESCKWVLVAESDNLAHEDLGDGTDNVSRRRHDELKQMLTKMEEQLKPLMDQLRRVKDLTVPDFGSLQDWELRANATGRASNGDLNGNDPSKYLLGFGGTPMPYVGEPKVEVAFSGTDEKGDVKSVDTNKTMKILPPWMIKEGMNLTREQRGETKMEANTGDNSISSELSDEKKSTTVNEDKKSIQNDYGINFYAAALERKQQLKKTKKEQEWPNTAIPSEVYNLPSERQVGMKSKRDDDNEGDDNEWEEGPSTGSTSEQSKVEAKAPEEDEDENDWEDG